MTILRRMAKTTLFVVPTVIAIAAMQPAIAQEDCDHSRRPGLTVTLEIPKPRIVEDQTRAQIQHISRDSGANPLQPGLLLNGLTVYNLETRHRIEVRQTDHRQKCFYPSRITASVTVRRLDVFIASELAHESCQRRVTLAHEMKHVTVLSDGATELRRKIEAALEDTPAFRTITAPDIDTALERFGIALNTIVNDVRTEVSRKMVRRNSALDTPEAYRADDALCR